MYQLENAITCEITDQASPNSVCEFFMDFNETLHIYSLRGSNMCQTNYFKWVYHASSGALVSNYFYFIIKIFKITFLHFSLTLFWLFQQNLVVTLLGVKGAYSRNMTSNDIDLGKWQQGKKNCIFALSLNN